MNENLQYARFWDRAGAYILDALILGSVSFGLNYLNIVNSKSFLLYLPVAVLGILYKPFMESYYGATLGKMALDLKVTDLSYAKINFEKSLLRSLIVIAPSLFYLPVYYVAFQDPQIINTDGFLDFSLKLASTYPAVGFITNILSVIFLADLVVLLVNNSKNARSLKDIMAATYVIKSKN